MDPLYLPAVAGLFIIHPRLVRLTFLSLDRRGIKADCHCAEAEPVFQFRIREGVFHYV